MQQGLIPQSIIGSGTGFNIKAYIALHCSIPKQCVSMGCVNVGFKQAYKCSHVLLDDSKQHSNIHNDLQKVGGFMKQGNISVIGSNKWALGIFRFPLIYDTFNYMVKSNIWRFGETAALLLMLIFMQFSNPIGWNSHDILLKMKSITRSIPVKYGPSKTLHYFDTYSLHVNSLCCHGVTTRLMVTGYNRAWLIDWTSLFSHFWQSLQCK